jgi:hypothetical protein
MAKAKKNTTVADEAAVVTKEVIVAVDVIATEEVNAVSLIPSGVFIAESGDEYEFTVSKFSFKGVRYTIDEALKSPEILELLVSLNSFILKKI